MEGAAVGPGAWNRERSGAAERAPSASQEGKAAPAGSGGLSVQGLAVPVPLTALVLSPSAKDAQAAAGQTRNFLVRASCRLRLEPGKEYLIMGLDGTTHDLKGQ